MYFYSNDTVSRIEHFSFEIDFLYHSNGQLSGRIHSDLTGILFTLEYDLQGRPLSHLDGEGNVIEKRVYDIFGDQTQTTAEGTQIFPVTYDRHPDSSTLKSIKVGKKVVFNVPQD